MSFIFNRGAIIFLVCSIVSLFPIAVSSLFVVFAKTFPNMYFFDIISFSGIFLLYFAPVSIFLMGDVLYYFKFVKHQDLAAQVKMQAVTGFFLAFTIYYIGYFLSIDVVTGFLHFLIQYSS